MERQSFRTVLGKSLKIMGNRAFQQNFRTRKLDEIAVFFAV